MKVRSRRFAVLLLAIAASLAVASPAMAKGGTGGGGGGGGGDVATAPCARIVSAIVDPNPLPINPNPVYPDPIVVTAGGTVRSPVAFDLTINNQCIDEVAAGPRGSISVSTTVYDNATGAPLFTFANMQPAGAIMTWRYWGSIPTADTVVPNYTDVISLFKANGQVQDTLTYTAAAMNQATLTAVATGTPVSLR